MTFASTANVIVHRGATPVFVDVEADTVQHGRRRCSKRAITPQDEGDHPGAFRRSAVRPGRDQRDRARAHGLPVIEDAAHAIGAEYQGQRASAASGNLTAFSFYATKNITSGGEGGALTTNDPALAERVADHEPARHQPRRVEAIQPSATSTGTSSAPGYKYNMFDLQAARARCRSSRRSKRSGRAVWRSRRGSTPRLRDVPEIVMPGGAPGLKHAYHLYPIVIRTEDADGRSRRDHERDPGGERRHRRPLPRRAPPSVLPGALGVPPRDVSATPSTTRTARSRCRSIRG